MSHLKNIAEADIIGPIAAQHCFLWMRCATYRMNVARLGRLVQPR